MGTAHRDGSDQDEGGRGSGGGFVRCAAGGGRAEDGLRRSRYGGPTTHQDESDGGTGKNAADGAADHSGRAARNPSCDGCDYGAKWAAAGAAVYRSGGSYW